MKRGERVTVIAFGQKELDRVVWEDEGEGILICTEQGFEDATRTGQEPISVAFPASDVRRKPMAAASSPTRERRKAS